MNTLISFIVVLGILIFVHELGHFLFAKLFGVRVLKFSLGFGNKLISRKWGETEYLISAFPLGGYVKMYGEQPGEEIAEEDKAVSFSHKSVGQRFWIVFGGPLFNLLFALLVFWLMVLIAGRPDVVDTTKIGKVNVGSPAEQAGIKPGDIVLSINGQQMTSWRQVSETVRNSSGKPLELVVQRDRETLTLEAVPVLDKVKDIFGEETGEARYLLGMTRSRSREWPAGGGRGQRRARLVDQQCSPPAGADVDPQEVSARHGSDLNAACASRARGSPARARARPSPRSCAPACSRTSRRGG